MKIQYTWSEDSFWSGRDAQVAGEALEEIRRKSGGDLTADAVIKASKAKSAPLHDFFEWDDVKAADHFRKEQARGVIASVRIVSTDERPVRAYFNVKTANGRSYQTRETVASMDDLRQQIVQEAADLLSRARERLEDVNGLRKAKKLVGEAHKAVTAHVKQRAA